VFAKLRCRAIIQHPSATALDFFRDAARDGVKAAMAKREMWNQMRMSPTDLADLSAATYTYLMNGTTPAGNWTGLIRRGERVRLRFINGAANTFYDVRIPGLKLRVVQVDGQDVEPMTVDEFRFGPGETLDAIVTPADDVHTIFAQSMERSGYARGTLAVREGLSAPVPATDPVEWLTMTDMMGDMGGLDHGAMDYSKMDHSKMDHSTMDHAAMDHAAMGHAAMGHGDAGAPAKASTRVRHARPNRIRPQLWTCAWTRRHQPGRPGHRPAVQRPPACSPTADLHTLGGALDERGAGREMEFHSPATWSATPGPSTAWKFGSSTPVHFRHGERLRVILHNDTMMTHPMHLHGMWSELEAPDGRLRCASTPSPLQPAQRISFSSTPKRRDAGRGTAT